MQNEFCTLPAVPRPQYYRGPMTGTVAPPRPLSSFSLLRLPLHSPAMGSLAQGPLILDRLLEIRQAGDVPAVDHAVAVGAENDHVFPWVGLTLPARTQEPKMMDLDEVLAPGAVGVFEVEPVPW